MKKIIDSRKITSVSDNIFLYKKEDLIRSAKKINGITYTQCIGSSFLKRTSSSSSSLHQKTNFSFIFSSLGKSELSSVQSSPKNELSSYSFVFRSILYDENFKKHLMRKENMKFDPKSFEKNSE